jgi:ParB family chromosome partitioning protein
MSAKTAEQLAFPSGLDLAGLGDLSSLLETPAAVSGGPIELDLDLIDEDPHQPRAFFDKASLQELAETIQSRGVKTPISVRPHAEVEGRFMINHGARRVRASRMAGRKTIPGFIDTDYSQEDQVIENLQRDALTPREVADFIGRELARGKKKGEIAKAIGKSPAFVTQHVTLLDLPVPIAETFKSGRCNDVTVVNELVTAYKKNPDEVTAWLGVESHEVTRGAVKGLREALNHRAERSNEIDLVSGSMESPDDDISEDSQKLPDDAKKAKKSDPNKLRKAIVHVRHGERPARLNLNRRPTAPGLAWLTYEDDQTEIETDLSNVLLVALLEG